MLINVTTQQKPRHRDGYENRLAPWGLSKCPVEKNLYYKSHSWNLSSATSAQHNGNDLYSGDLGNIEQVT